jgi:hypothetical protein
MAARHASKGGVFSFDHPRPRGFVCFGLKGSFSLALALEFGVSSAVWSLAFQTPFGVWRLALFWVLVFLDVDAQLHSE